MYANLVYRESSRAIQGKPVLGGEKRIGVSLLNLYSKYRQVLLVYQEELYILKSYSYLSAVAPVLVN